MLQEVGDTSISFFITQFNNVEGRNICEMLPVHRKTDIDDRLIICDRQLIIE